MNNLSRWYATFFVLASVLVAAGCGKTEEARETAIPTPSPTPTPAPRLGAVVEGARFAFSDTNGKRVAEIMAESGAATGAGADDAVGEMRNARATLYRDGVPAATMTANKLEPDTRTRTITGTGNVRLTSRTLFNGVVTAVRADRMVWEYDRDKIHGTGNVLVTHGDTVRMPAIAIDADTALQTVNMTGGGAPITGTY